MIKVSVFYPNPENCRFDFDYYCDSHLPMVRQRLGEPCKGIALDEALAGEGAARPAFVAICHLFFESVPAFEAAFGPHQEEIMGDVPNYTNVTPSVLISKVRINATRSQSGELHLHQAAAG